MSGKLNVLVVSGDTGYPLRASIRDAIYAFRYNPDCNAFFYYTEQGPFPEYLKKISFDLIVFTTTWAAERWRGRDGLHKFVYKQLDHLKNWNIPKAVLPQDEWIFTDLLNEMINDFNISHVFSVAPPSEWPKIYNRVDPAKVKFHQVLTGYLEDSTVSKIERIVNTIGKPKVDVGYRAYKAPPWLGSHGFLKTQIAEVFQQEAPNAGFTTDISTDKKDTITGDKWFEFLAGCKYFIGVEGGSSVLDPDGQIFLKATAYQKEHPNTTFEEFERRFFPGMNGNLSLKALSPRHLEACATKTCQVLIEGSYNGVLVPGRHYIELKKDFSNLKEVFVKMKDETLRQQIVKNAYDDIVASGKYSSLGYTKTVLDLSLEKKPPSSKNNPFSLLHNRLSEKRYWNKRHKEHSKSQSAA